MSATLQFLSTTASWPCHFRRGPAAERDQLLGCALVMLTQRIAGTSGGRFRASATRDYAGRVTVPRRGGVWDSLRGNKLSHRKWVSYQAIVEACHEALRFLMADPGRIRSIATRRWACVSV